MIVGFLYDSTGSYNLPFHIAGIPLLVGAVILFFIPWAQKTADTTNLMSAAHTYAPSEAADRESLGTEFGSIATTDRAMTPIPEIVLAVDSSFVTIDLDDGESYTVPRRIKRRKRDVSMCSDLSSVSEMVNETVEEIARQGLSYAKLENENLDVPSFTGSQGASLATSPRSRQFDGAMQHSTPQVCTFKLWFYIEIFVD